MVHMTYVMEELTFRLLLLIRHYRADEPAQKKKKNTPMAFNSIQWLMLRSYCFFKLFSTSLCEKKKMPPPPSTIQAEIYL